MPRQTDYSTGKIYFLWSNLDPRIYIGSTVTPLNARLACHMYEARHERNMSKLYRTMRQVGIDSYRIDLLIDFSCDSRDELEVEEFEVMTEFEPEDLLNEDIVFRKRPCVTGSRHRNWKGGSISHVESRKYFHVEWCEDGIRHAKYFPYTKKHNRSPEEALKAAKEFKANLFKDSEDSD